MKVQIGNYRNWIGPYQITDAIFFWVDRGGIFAHEPEIYSRWDYRLSEKFGDWLATTWVNDFCNWIHSKQQRKMKIHIDPYDTWSMDSTLAYIIHPMLIQLQATKHGSPYVDDEDLPEHLRSIKDDDEKFHDRWDWVMNEMIWAFGNLNTDWDDEFHKEPEGEWSLENCGTFDREGILAVQKRMSNGFKLFGKYYQNLWD